MDVDIFNSMLKPGDRVYAETGRIKVLSPSMAVHNLTVRTPKIDMSTNRHLLAAIEEFCARKRRDWFAKKFPAWPAFIQPLNTSINSAYIQN